MSHGGRRPGAGRKKGAKVLEKEAMRERLRAMVSAEFSPLIAAQLENAKGIKFLVARQKSTGKFTRLTEAQARLKEGQESDTEIIEVWEKDPSVQAFTDLMNRAIDKPVEQVVMDADVTVRGDQVLARLVAGRKRVAEAKRA